MYTSRKVSKVIKQVVFLLEGVKSKICSKCFLSEQKLHLFIRGIFIFYSCLFCLVSCKQKSKKITTFVNLEFKQIEYEINLQESISDSASLYFNQKDTIQIHFYKTDSIQVSIHLNSKKKITMSEKAYICNRSFVFNHDTLQFYVTKDNNVRDSGLGFVLEGGKLIAITNVFKNGFYSSEFDYRALINSDLNCDFRQ